MITLHRHHARPGPGPIEREALSIGAALGEAAAGRAEPDELGAIVRRLDRIEDILKSRQFAEQGVIAQMIIFVCATTDLKQTELISNRRARRQAFPRFAIMWAAKELTSYSFPQIGRALGGFDHTSVMHGCRRAEQLREADPDFRALTDALIAHFTPKPKTEEADPCLPL